MLATLLAPDPESPSPRFLKKLPTNSEQEKNPISGQIGSDFWPKKVPRHGGLQGVTAFHNLV